MTLSHLPMAHASSKAAKQSQSSVPPGILVTYGLFFTFSMAVYHFFAEGEFSAILTLSVIMQCLAIALLAIQCHSSGSASGISAKALMMEGASLVCRLSSTLWLNGYLPVDATGDHLFQIVDICSLGIVAYLLHHVLMTQRHTYQAELDSLPMPSLVIGCFVAAALLHADMNDRPLFDTLWMAGLFLGIAAVLPQLWLVAKANGRVQALTSHYIAVMAVSRLLSGSFMWHARFDLTCQPWVEGMNHAVWAILGAHALHLLLLGDFAYYYVKAIFSRGIQSLDYIDCGCFV